MLSVSPMMMGGQLALVNQTEWILADRPFGDIRPGNGFFYPNLANRFGMHAPVNVPVPRDVLPISRHINLRVPNSISRSAILGNRAEGMFAGKHHGAMVFTAVMDRLILNVDRHGIDPVNFDPKFRFDHRQLVRRQLLAGIANIRPAYADNYHCRK